MLPLLGGFVAGFLHVLSGPDHLSAIAPLSAHNPEHSSRAGLRWGIGHTTGVCLLGLLVLLFKNAIPLDKLSGTGEKLVGLVLISIGIWSIRSAMYPNSSGSHTHKQTITHTHTHPHTGIASFYIGILHGIAGTSHIFGIVPALAFKSTFESVVYLVSFGVGTVLAMTVFSGLLGYLTAYFSPRYPGLQKQILTAAGGIAIAVGVAWMFIG